MSVQTEQHHLNAHVIAENMSTKDYFISEQEKLIDDWANKAVELFKYKLIHLDLQDKY
jgi:hypothetical protein